LTVAATIGGMVNSRSLSDLLPHARARAQAFLDACGKQGIDILITSTYRDLDSQAALYAQGRTVPGKRVTNASLARASITGA
jgi:peptidoglycan L-alanyl-D-glutamate endopeptidase CwlK